MSPKGSQSDGGDARHFDRRDTEPHDDAHYKSDVEWAAERMAEGAHYLRDRLHQDEQGHGSTG